MTVEIRCVTLLTCTSLLTFPRYVYLCSTSFDKETDTDIVSSCKLDNLRYRHVVDDDCASELALFVLGLENMLQQGGLACTEKTCKQRHCQPLVSSFLSRGVAEMRGLSFRHSNHKTDIPLNICLLSALVYSSSRTFTPFSSSRTLDSLRILRKNCNSKDLQYLSFVVFLNI